MPTAATKPKTAAAVNGDTPAAEPPAEPPLYGDKPTFTYVPKDGGDPIIFPAHSTILGEVWCTKTTPERNLKYLEFLWEMDKARLGSADQIFWYVDRSGATDDEQRKAIRLEQEVNDFLRAWINAEDEPPVVFPELPPES